LLFIPNYFLFPFHFQTAGDIMPFHSFLPEARKQDSNVTHQALGIQEAETSFHDDGIFSDESFSEKDFIDITTNKKTDGQTHAPRKRKNTIMKEL